MQDSPASSSVDVISPLQVSMDVPPRADKWSDKFLIVVFKEKTVLEHLIELGIRHSSVTISLNYVILIAAFNDRVFEGKGVTFA